MDAIDLSACRDIEPGATIFAGPEAYRVLRGNDPPPPGTVVDLLNGIGVRRADGTASRFGTDIYRHRRSRPLKLHQVQGPVSARSGRAIYAGAIGQDFGHQLTQSLGRLWATGEFPDAPLLFAATSPAFTVLPGYFVQVIRKLGVTNPIELLGGPMTVEDLVVPQDLCNLHRRPSIAPAFAEWLADRRPPVPPDRDLAIYVSRSGLALSRGQYLQERSLEDGLAVEGYRIVRPEALPIEEQIDLYLRAGRLIFADGSAVHLWSLFGHPDQRAALILRRPPDPHMVRWFGGLPRLDLSVHDNRIADFSHRGGPSGKSAALLDIQALWSDLRQAGYHRSATPPGHPKAMLDAWIAAVIAGERALDALPFEIDDHSRALLASRPSATPSRPAES